MTPAGAGPWRALLRLLHGRSKQSKHDFTNGAGEAAADAVLPPSAATALDERMMDAALDLARQASALGEVPVGAVVYRTPTQGEPPELLSPAHDAARIVGRGYNRREIDRDPSAHAELIAMREAARTVGDWRLSGCTLVVTLEPCPMCAGLIVAARVGRVVYGCDDPKAGACRSLYQLTTDPRLNHRVRPIGGVRSGEASALLREFFQTLRRTRRER